MGRNTVNNAGENTASKDRVFDWVAMIVCFVCAFFIWFYVMQVDSPEYEDVISGVTIDIINTSALEDNFDLSIYSGYGNLLEVKLIGKKSEISKLTPEDITAYVDAASISSSGYHSLDVHVNVPSGIKLGGTSLNAINVYADKKDVKTVSVKVKLSSITVAKPLELGIPTPEYDTVTLTGPKSALDSISHAQVNLSLGNITSSVTVIGEISLIDKDGNVIDNPYIKSSRTEIKATVPVYTTKTVHLTVDLVYGLLGADNSEITISPSEITLRGDPATLDNLTSLIVTTIDEKKLSGDITKTVAIPLPDGTTVVGGNDSANISVKLVNTALRTVTVTDIDAKDATVPYTILDTSVKITLRGSPADLANIKKSDISVKVDLSEFTSDMSGIFTANATVIIDAQTDQPVYEIGEYTVQVAINQTDN